MFVLGQQLQILYGTVMKIYELKTGNFSAVPINVVGALIKKACEMPEMSCVCTVHTVLASRVNI
jgi:hypothetical protein